MLAAFESQRQDLEYAVLTQELMTLKVKSEHISGRHKMADSHGKHNGRFDKRNKTTEYVKGT